MKIGIFGDSFCNKVRVNEPVPVIWYNFLQKDFGHAIDCYGEAGSSILFSAQLIKQHAVNYDLVIWCVTTPGRFSFPAGNQSYHVTTSSDAYRTDDPDLVKKHKVCVDYLKYVFDWESENLVGQALVTYIQTLFSNVMVIPCFSSPLSTEFNLYDISQRELEFYFPGKEPADIYKDYLDMRAAHLTLGNHKILAELVNDNLKPGVFQTSYDNFPDPTTPFDQIFKPVGFTLPPL
jgi:hypothetical protein